jgi:hypothetical protein
MSMIFSTNGEERTTYRILVAKPEGNCQLGTQIHRGVDNIKMEFTEIGQGGLD